MVKVASEASGNLPIQLRQIVASHPDQNSSVFSLNMLGAGARWCRNVGRCHNSNFAYWVADIETQRCWQKCFDQGSCRGYRSAAVCMDRLSM